MAQADRPAAKVDEDEGDAVPTLAASPKARSLTGRTLVALAWQLGNKVIEAGGRILVMIVLARLLSPSAFGVASVGLVVASFGTTLTQLGVAPALVQRAELTPAHIGSGFLCSVAMGVVGFATVWFSADAIAAFFRMPELAAVTRAVAFCFPITAPTMVAEALLMRELAFKTLTKIDTISFVLGYSALGIGMALLGYGLWSLVAAQLGQVGLRGVLILSASRQPFTFRFSRSALADLLRFGTGHTLAELGNFLALQGDNMVIGRTMGAAPLGLYSRAYTLLAQPARLVGLVFDRVLFPAMSRVQGEGSRIVRAQTRALAGIALVMIPGSTLLVLLAPEVIVALLGPKWLGATIPFQILGSTLLFRTSYKVSDSVVRACGASFRRAWRQWAYAGMVLGGAALGSRWGLVGVSVGVGLAVLGNYAMMLQLSLSLTGGKLSELLRLYARIALGTLPAAAVAVALTLTMRRLEVSAIPLLLATGGAFGAVFALTLLLRPRLFGADGEAIVAQANRRLPLLRR